MIREIFVLWPIGLFFAIFLYDLPQSVCAFPNATYLYNLAHCQQYNADRLAGADRILLLVTSGLGAFGWITIFHDFLEEKKK